MVKQAYREWDQDSVFPAHGAPFFSEHLARYKFAQGFVRSKSVLELGCGKGYGTHVLAAVAREVIALDLNESSLRFCRENYNAPNITFLRHDVTNLASFEGQFDVIIAFELIEHLPPELTEAFLSGISQKLAPNGILLISTPNHEVVVKSRSPVPDFHINNFRPLALKNILGQYFPSVKMIGQVRSHGIIGNVVYWFDWMHLRHLPWLKIKRPLKIPPETRAFNPGPIGLWQMNQGWGDSEGFFFSKYYWRQAGLTVAICRKSKSESV